MYLWRLCHLCNCCFVSPMMFHFQAHFYLSDACFTSPNAVSLLQTLFYLSKHCFSSKVFSFLPTLWHFWRLLHINNCLISRKVVTLQTLLHFFKPSFKCMKLVALLETLLHCFKSWFVSWMLFQFSNTVLFLRTVFYMSDFFKFCSSAQNVATIFEIWFISP